MLTFKPTFIFPFEIWFIIWMHNFISILYIMGNGLLNLILLKSTISNKGIQNQTWNFARALLVEDFCKNLLSPSSCSTGLSLTLFWSWTSLLSPELGTSQPQLVPKPSTMNRKCKYELLISGLKIYYPDYFDLNKIYIQYVLI